MHAAVCRCSWRLSESWLTTVADKWLLPVTVPVLPVSRMFKVCCHTVLSPVLVIWFFCFPVSKCGGPSIRPLPGISEKADPGRSIFSRHQLLYPPILWHISRTGQVCVMSPAVALSLSPCHRFVDEHKCLILPWKWTKVKCEVHKHEGYIFTLATTETNRPKKSLNQEWSVHDLFDGRAQIEILTSDIRADCTEGFVTGFIIPFSTDKNLCTKFVSPFIVRLSRLPVSELSLITSVRPRPPPAAHVIVQPDPGSL